MTGGTLEPIVPRFYDAGETALVVEFGRTVDPAINDRVLALDAALAAEKLVGISELVPTYRSLMIHYDPLAVSRAYLCETVLALAARNKGERQTLGDRHWTLPCCYEGPHGEDLDEVCRLTGLSRDAVIQAHSSADYRIYMYGFAPAYCYLGGLPEALAISRREKPRPPHAAGAVMIGGGLASVTPFPMPTGWYVLGRTPEQLYQPARQNPFLLRPGDTIRFEPIDADLFARLEERALAGEIVARESMRAEEGP